MPLPHLKPGLVFRYEYVWKRQHLAGQSVGEKERPVCCVAVSVAGGISETRLLIVPITTQQPVEVTSAIEIPELVRRHLGLEGDRRCWVILSEANVDVWPSPDMRQIPGKPGRFDYGLLLHRTYSKVRTAIFRSPLTSVPA